MGKMEDGILELNVEDHCKMNIQDIKIKQNKLDDQISSLIRQFEEETNCSVYDINLKDFHSVPDGEIFLYAKTQVKI